MADISLCMIALNAEKTLGACLESVMDYVREIVVVDTGSKDATAEIALAHGALVVPFTHKTHPKAFARDKPPLGPPPHTGKPFLVNFAEARNFSFELATREFVMWLDADDVVENAEALISVIDGMRAANVPSAWFRYSDGDRSWWRERIVRRGGGARWGCAVHEVLLGLSGEFKFDAPRIVHRGKGGSGGSAETGRVAFRNYKILLREHARDRDEFDPRLCYYLGLEADAHGDTKLAIWALDRCVRHASFAEQRMHARLALAMVYRAQKMPEDAMQQYAAASVEAAEMPHPWLGLAALMYERKEWAKCVEFTRKGLGLLGKDGSLWAPARADLVVAWQMLNYSLDLTGRTKEALEAAENGLLLEPDNKYLIQNRDAYRRALGMIRVQTPVVVTPCLPDTGEPIVLLLPSRGRPKNALETVRSAFATAANTSKVNVIVGVESDDEAAYRECLHFNDSVLHVLRRGGNYVAAVRELHKLKEASIYGLIADDFRFETAGWDTAIRHEFHACPGRLGLVFCNDGFRHGNLATAPFLSCEWIDTVGDVLLGNYTHWWCDTEIDDLARRSGTIRYLPDVAIRHDHWLTGAKKDASYEHTGRTNDAGRVEFERRAREREKLAGKIRQAASRAPKLSVLIPSLHRRSDMLSGLMSSLEAQRMALPQPDHVEFAVAADDGEITIGAKRNRLMADARGLYVAFIDDDDAVAPDYLRSLLAAISTGPDCVTFRGVMTSDGGVPVGFDLALAHLEWGRSPDGILLRGPNHLCAIRTGVAKAVPFPEANYGEDRIWSTAIRPYLAAECHVDRTLYMYRWRSSDHQQPPLP